MHVSHVASFRYDKDVEVLYRIQQFLISNFDHVFKTQPQMMRSVQLWPFCTHLGQWLSSEWPAHWVAEKEVTI